MPERVYKNKSVVSGLKIGDILDAGYDAFAGLSDKDLRAVVSRLGSAANKRYKRFIDSGDESPATVELERGGGRISVRGKDRASLENEFERARNFLESESSSVSQWKGIKKKTIEGIKESPSALDDQAEISLEEFNDFWKAYDAIRKITPKVDQESYRYEVYNRLARTMHRGANADKSPDQIVALVKKQMDKEYREKERESNDRFGGTSKLLARRK